MANRGIRFDGSDSRFPDITYFPFLVPHLEKAAKVALKHRFSFLSLDHLLYALLDDGTFSSIIQAAGGDLEIFKGSLEAHFRDCASQIDKGSKASDLELAPVLAELLNGWPKWVRAIEHGGDSQGRSEFFFDVMDRLGASVPVEQAILNCGASALLYRAEDDASDQLNAMSFEENQRLLDELSAGKPANEPIKSASSKPTHVKAKTGQGGSSQSEKAREDLVRDVDAALTNLIDKVRQGKVDPVLGRDDVIDRVFSAIRRRRKSSVVLYGEAGVGKTAIAEGIALRLTETCQDADLVGRPFYELSLPDLVAGTKFRGDFEARMKLLIDRLKEERAIVFVDEFHMVVGAGSTYGKGMDGANMLKTALGRGEITVIGATTPIEMRELRQDGAMMRRFEAIHVPEMTPAQTLDVLKKGSAPYLQHHELMIAEAVCAEIVSLADQFMPAKHFPDKAFELLDIACVAAREDAAALRILDVKHVHEAADRLGLRRPRRPNEQDIAAIDCLREELVTTLGGGAKATGKLLHLARTSLMNMRAHGMRAQWVLASSPDVSRREIAKAFAKGLGYPMLEVDLSAMSAPGSLPKLIGYPQSHGLDRTGRLVEAADGYEDMVLFLDNLDACDRDVRDLIEGLAETGQFRAADGRLLSLGRAWLVLGVEIEKEGKTPLGFGTTQPVSRHDDISKKIGTALFDGSDLVIRQTESAKERGAALVAAEIARLPHVFGEIAKRLTFDETEHKKMQTMGDRAAIRAYLQKRVQDMMLEEYWDGAHASGDAKDTCPV